MRHIISFLILFILIATCNCFAQNKAIADSCKDMLLKDKSLNDSLRFNLMVKVVFNQINSDSVLFYADYLIHQAEKKSNTLFIAKGYYFKAIGFSQKSKNDIALELLIRSINEATKVDNKRLVSVCYLEMGNVYGSLNDYNNSIKSYLTAINILKTLNCKQELSSAYLNMGSDYLSLNKLDSALLYYSLSDSLFLLLNDDLSGAYAKGNIGIILAKQNHWDQARVNLNKAYSILEKEQHLQAAIAYKLWLSVIEQKSLNFPLALKYATECLKMAEKCDLKENIRDTHEQLSEIYSKLGRYKEANDALKQFYAYRDSIVNTETITKMANLRTEFEVGQKQVELDAMAGNERFKTLIAWILLGALSSVAVLLVIVYCNYQRKKRLLAQLNLQKTELELANTTKNRFFSVIAHDLRGPMGALGSLVVLANDTLVNGSTTDLKSLLTMMGDNSREVESLLNNLLHWSVGQKGDYQKHCDTVDFTQLVNDAINIYQHIAIAKGINLTFNPAIQTHMVITDHNSWAVIVRNLVNNAIKFTHSGGQVEITSTQNENTLVLKVTDTGIGMDESVVANLFKNIVNISQSGTNYEKGMGIGLSLIKDFVDINNGQIEVTSVLGEGTCFTVTIPVGKVAV